MEVDATCTDGYFQLDGFWRYYLSPEATDGSCLLKRGMVVPEGLRVGLLPFFDSLVIEDLGDQERVQIADGTRVLRHKQGGSIPRHEGYILRDRASWEAHYKPRLCPDSPGRFPVDWSAWDVAASNPLREHILILPAGSLYGWIRNWMGVEEVSYLIYDDPALFQEMVNTIADCVCGALETVLSRPGAVFDAAFFWEDMSFNKGPLISPRQFQDFLSPSYRRITSILRKASVEHIIVDSDGSLDELIPLWLDAGVNTVLPLEIGTTGSDPVKTRARFGKDLKMIGGFDKRILASTKEAIETEIRRLAPLVGSGGFIPCCDHKVPPDVSLENYRFFLDAARNIWL